MAAGFDFDNLVGFDTSRLGPISELRKRAESGEAQAQYLLGNVYYYGLNQYDYKYKPDSAEAMKWFLMAAENGHAAAMYQVGRMKNREQALGWYKRSAEDGYKWAQLHLGEIYMHFMSERLGVTKDYAEAYFWLSLATALESPSRNFAEHRETAKGYLSPEKLKEVEKRLEEWKKNPPVDFRVITSKQALPVSAG